MRRKDSMDIKSMSVEQLKALAYDLMLEGQRIQTNLQMIGVEIEQRKKLPEEGKPELPKEDGKDEEKTA